jgi:hypothetical protein
VVDVVDGAGVAVFADELHAAASNPMLIAATAVRPKRVLGTWSPLSDGDRSVRCRP